jgi:hypothetical protein
MFKIIFNAIDLIPDWVYGKKWIMGLLFAMALGSILNRINKLKA